MEWTRNFQKAFEKCGEKDLVLQEIRRLQMYFEGKRELSPNTWPRNSKPIVGPSNEYAKRYGHSLKEWRIDRRGRIVFSAENGITLIDFSLQHDSVEKLGLLKPSEIGDILGSSTLVPEQLLRVRVKRANTHLTTSITGINWSMYEEKQYPNWVHFLDTEQVEVSTNIFSKIIANPGFSFSLITGGAGTGKTMVLRDLANRLFTESSKAVEFSAPLNVKRFLLSGGGAIPGISFSTPKRCAILCDDPTIFEDLEAKLIEAKAKDLPFVVAIDPIQWSERKSVEKFKKVLEIWKPDEYRLKTVYRQGEAVGSQAIKTIKNFLANSSPYRDPFQVSKFRSNSALFEHISLDGVKFAEQRGGYRFVSKSEPFFKALLEELQACAEHETIRSWPKLLLASNFSGKLPMGVPAVMQTWQSIYKNIYGEKFGYDVKSFSQVDSVRGIEFESVVIFITSQAWKDLTEGGSAVTDQEWQWLTNPITFLTRAENRCAIFEVPDDAAFLQSGNIFVRDDLKGEVNDALAPWGMKLRDS